MNKQFTFPIHYGLQNTGLPLIVVQHEKSELCFLLDTGSTFNLIRAMVAQMLNCPTQDSTISIHSLTGSQDEQKGVEISFIFEDMTFHEQFICCELSEGFNAIEKETGVQIHGILGSNFFLKHGWIIDYDKMIVYSKSPPE